MLPKPEHLGPDYGAQFQDQSVVAAYRFRPPYPDEVFRILAGLITDRPRAVLDAGCGDGAIARHLVGQVERIDAVDLSQGMIEQGKRLPSGDHPRLRWICAPMEDAPLEPPYALITAGASLHWMDWQVVLPRFRQALTPLGMLAIIYDEMLPLPWDDALRSLIRRSSTNQKFQPYDTIEELERRGLFTKVGEQRAAPLPFAQPVDDYIESFHARNGFSRERMSREAAADFDHKVRRLLTDFCPDGIVAMQVTARVVWGRPQAG
ncbi:MAG TPA: class I SAM-dependent methyltransferase [Ktedonobacterales bacterium]|nr:class I SAM-dependent methyltransferase [Ktedonobacterales bacterium]